MYTDGKRARRELGALIVKARKAVPTGSTRTMTQQDLADAVGCSQGMIQKIERGRVSVKSTTMELLIEALGVETEPAARMRRLARVTGNTVPWSGERSLVPEFARDYFDGEMDALEILSYHELRIPGALQSEHYMLSEFGAAGRTDVQPYVRNREIRKEIFRRSDLMRYCCVLAEEALHRSAGTFGADVVCDEIDHLLAVNDPHHRPDLGDERTSVLLLPLAAPFPDPPGDFSVLLFANPADSYVYYENHGRADYDNKPQNVEKVVENWRRIERIALDRTSTCDVLRKLRERFANG